MKLTPLTTLTELDLKLANNETEKAALKVSRLPLPISDSPLVIDLPDGQKIVIGKMTQGSVIEVATWRGVGRPDSRTSRLMLGVGNGNVNEDNEGEDSSNPGSSPSKATQKIKGFSGVIYTLEQFFKNFNQINWSATFKALVASKASKKAKRVKSDPTPVDVEQNISPEATVTPASEDADIEAWLNKITEQASRSTTKKSQPAAKKSPAKKAVAKKSPAKKATVTKKAVPKTTKKR